MPRTDQIKWWVVLGILLGMLTACASRENAAATSSLEPKGEDSSAQVAALPSDNRELPPTTLEVAPEEYRRLFDAARRVLREAGFHLDRQDYRLGVITTRPQAAPTVFEPWHTTNKTANSTLENTLNDQRRIIRMQLLPQSPTDISTYHLQVEVQLERRQHSLQRLEGSTDTARIIGKSAADPLIPTSTPDYWRPMGRDVVLEQFLLERIVRQSLSLTQP